MLRIISSILFVFCFLVTNAQFGVSSKFDNNNFSSWNNNVSLNDVILSNDWYDQDITFGVNYWFRLKNKRIEFLPELNYSLKHSENSKIDGLFETDFQRIGFKFNTHLYVLDFVGDCNCPTFSKDSEFIKKGFFLILSPGVDRVSTNTIGTDQTTANNNSWAFNFGIGAGLDFGLSNLLTISPFILLNFYPGISSEHLIYLENEILNPNGEISNIPLSSSNRQIQFGIRFGFRPDYKY